MSIEIKEVMDCLLPHRYPFLLVDRVLDWNKYQSLKAYKHVSVNEPFFSGHFPGHPIMPGVLIVEALAQAVGILMMQSYREEMNDPEPKSQGLFFLAGIDQARFRKVVIPGDRLDLEIEVQQSRLSLWKCQGIASVDGQQACSAVILIAKGSSGE